jgi:hypothetical protein
MIEYGIQVGKIGFDRLNFLVKYLAFRAKNSLTGKPEGRGNNFRNRLWH